MRRLIDAFRRSPVLMALIVAASCAAIVSGASVVYAVKVQPDPQVIRRAEPVTNTGVDANGLTLDQWIARGQTPESYRPVVKTIFKAGETMWVLRADCFVNKTSEGKVYRVFYGGDRRDKNGDLDLTKTSGSQYMLPPVPIPSRSDGCPVKNHRTLIELDMPPQLWTYAPGVDFYKSMIQPSVRVHFRPVVIEVVK